MAKKISLEIQALVMSEVPYGKWTYSDGKEILFNRDRKPLWERAGSHIPIKRVEWDVSRKDVVKLEHFWNDKTPREERQTIGDGVLIEWGAPLSSATTGPLESDLRFGELVDESADDSIPAEPSWRDGLQPSRRGGYLSNLHNAVYVLENDPALTALRKALAFTGPNRLSNSFVFGTQIYLQKTGLHSASTATARKALEAVFVHRQQDLCAARNPS